MLVGCVKVQETRAAERGLARGPCGPDRHDLNIGAKLLIRIEITSRPTMPPGGVPWNRQADGGVTPDWTGRRGPG